MARAGSVVRKRTHPRRRSERLRFPPSERRAIELASMGFIPGELAGEQGRYEVLLSDQCGDRHASFRTNVFTGPNRVDLEDACEWGGYDTVLVRRRRGSLGGKEAGRLLKEILEDLTYEVGHDLKFFLLDAERDGVLVQLHTDFDPLVRKGGVPFKAGLLEVLQLSGFDPVVERATRRWLDLSIGPRGARGSLLVPMGSAPAHAIPLTTGSRSSKTKVLVRPQDRSSDSSGKGTERNLRLATLFRALHAARIGTIEMRFGKT
jgi:hypothetical protein